MGGGLISGMGNGSKKLFLRWEKIIAWDTHGNDAKKWEKLVMQERGRLLDPCPGVGGKGLNLEHRKHVL